MQAVKNECGHLPPTAQRPVILTSMDIRRYVRKLLEFFFQIHDPTTRNRQGNDIGTSYRSAIFYLDDDQRKTAENLIKEMTAAKKWPGAIVTEVVPASDFWRAEEEHQNYLQKYPNGYTCHWVRPDWTIT